MKIIKSNPFNAKFFVRYDASSSNPIDITEMNLLNSNFYLSDKISIYSMQDFSQPQKRNRKSNNKAAKLSEKIIVGDAQSWQAFILLRQKALKDKNVLKGENALKDDFEAQSKNLIAPDLTPIIASKYPQLFNLIYPDIRILNNQ